MAKQKISLKVGGKAYQMTIDSDKEEIYRLAEREVNGAIGRALLQLTYVLSRPELLLSVQRQRK